MRHLTKLTVAAAVAALALAVVASTAAAEVKNAKWSHNELSVTGSVTFTKGGGTPSTCTFNALGGAQKGGSEFIIYNDQFIHGASCTYTSWFSWELRGNAKYDTVTKTYFLDAEDGMGSSYSVSPWGSSDLWYTGGTKVKPPYANGSGATPSTITFNEVTVGKMKTGQTVVANGQLKVVDFQTKQAVTLE